MTPVVTLSYIPRSFTGDPHIRVTIFRECGSAILEIGYAAIVEICEPKSDRRKDLLEAFHKNLPALLKILKTTIASIPPGDVVFVTQTMLRSNKIVAARGQPRLNISRPPPAISIPGPPTRSSGRTSVEARSQIKSEKGLSGGSRPTTMRVPRGSQ
jgi:hypothetical protein